MRWLTSSVVASSTAAAPSVLEASSVTPWWASVVIALEATTTSAAPEAATTSVVKALFRGWPGLATFLVVLPHQLVGLFPLQLNEQHLIQEVPDIRQCEVGWEEGRAPEGTGRGQYLPPSGSDTPGTLACQKGDGRGDE